MKTYTNPIIPGFYPDPSICRVTDDYYVVTSSFEYFPGIPIFHSKDLVNWEQIGHVLDRPSQLNLDGLKPSQGIWAPTIRYNMGVFYVITTNSGGEGNFIVTATDPAGPWSEPYFLKDYPGYDPSLFFDDDGKVYCAGNRLREAGERFFGDLESWIQEFDLKTMQLTGNKHIVWSGAGGIFPEAQHIYKVEGQYYLMVAEGTTFHEHAVTIARSKNIFGLYEGSPRNPVLTHRHLGKEYPIVNVGHGDLIQTQKGEWWMVVLASRHYGGFYNPAEMGQESYYGGYYRNMGRETFMVPVKWENGWPLASSITGRVEFEHPVPQLPEFKLASRPECDQFESKVLDFQWNFIRTPREQFWSLTERPGYLRLRLRPQKIENLENPSFVGRRQQHINFSVRTKIEFTPLNENEIAGLVLFQNNDYHYRLVLTLKENFQIIQLIQRLGGEDNILAESNISSSPIYLKVEAFGQKLSFWYSFVYEDWEMLIQNVDGRILSSDIAGGRFGTFTGTYIGLYASSNDKDSKNFADFDWFEYKGELECVFSDTR